MGGGGGLRCAAVLDAESVKPHEAGILKLDCAKSKSVLGWRPEWQIEQAVEEVASWLRVYASHGDIRSYMDDVISLRHW